MGISGDAGNKRKRKNVTLGNEETDFNSDTDVICSSQPLIPCKNKRNTEAEHVKKTKKFKKSSVHIEPEKIVTGSSSSTSENINFKIPPAECEVRKKRKKNKHLTSENGEAVRNSDTDVISTSQKFISRCENLNKLKNINETDVLQEKPLKKKVKKACVENELQDILIESSSPHKIKNNKLKSWSSEIEDCEALADGDQVQKKRKRNKHKTTKNEEIVLNSDAEVISASQTLDSCNENRHEFRNYNETEVEQEKRIKKKSVKVKLEKEEEITTESSDILNIEDNNSQSCFSETENCRALTDDHHVQKRRKKNKHKKTKNEEIDFNSDTEVISASQTLDSCDENRHKFENHDETEIKQEKRIKKKSVKVKLENEEEEITTESSDTLNIEDNNSKNCFSEIENCEALTNDHQVQKKRKKNKHKTTKNEEINLNSDAEVISASQTLDSCDKNTHISETDRQEKPIKKKSVRVKLENEEEMTIESSSEIENCQSSTDGHHAQKRRKKNKHKTTNEFENTCAINQEQETVEKKSKKRFKQDYEPDTDIKLENITAVEDADKKKEKNKDDNTDKKSTKHNISDHKMSKGSDADWNSSVDDAANVSGKSENMLDTARSMGKKMVIQLLKETTSVDRLKDELNLELDDVILEKLGRLRVEIPWDIPLIHKLAHAVSVAPTLDQRKALEDANIKIKLGKFTKEEDKKIEANWKLFCKYHDWDEGNYVPFLKNSKQSKHGYLPRGSFRKFVQFISHNFLDRLMYNIYARFQRIFSKNLVDSQLFTPEEDEIIMQYKDKSNVTKPFADLAVLLNRPRLAVLKRYKRIQEEKSFEKKKIIWNYELTKELLLKILEVTGAKCLASLKERHLAAGEWDRISEAMGIPVAKLKRFWLMDLYTRVFNPKYDENLDKVRMELVKTLKENYNDWREVDWQELSNKFDSYTSQRLYKIFMDLVKTKVPRSEQKDFKACFEYLKEFPQSRKRFMFVQNIVKELEMKNGIDSVQTETKCTQ